MTLGGVPLCLINHVNAGLTLCAMFSEAWHLGLATSRNVQDDFGAYWGSIEHRQAQDKTGRSLVGSKNDFGGADCMNRFADPQNELCFSALYYHYHHIESISLSSRVSNSPSVLKDSCENLGRPDQRVIETYRSGSNLGTSKIG